MTETRLIEIANITFDESLQIRSKTHTATVNQYANSIEANSDRLDDPVARGFPPILVEEYQREGGRKAYWLIGGFHRVAAAKKVGRTLIEADVAPESPPDERLWKSAKDNLKHGRTLTRSERIKAFKAYIAANHHREEGPKGGRKNQPFKAIAQMRRDLGGVKYETLRGWMWDHANPTYKQVFQGDGSSYDEEPDDEWHVDLNEVAERRDLAEAMKAADLLAGLVRSLRNHPSLWDVSDRLDEIRTEIRDRAGTRPSAFD